MGRSHRGCWNDEGHRLCCGLQTYFARELAVILAKKPPDVALRKGVKTLSAFRKFPVALQRLNYTQRQRGGCRLRCPRGRAARPIASAACQRRQAVVGQQAKRQQISFHGYRCARIQTRCRCSSSSHCTHRMVSSIRSMAAGSGGKR